SRRSGDRVGPAAEVGPGTGAGPGSAVTARDPCVARQARAGAGGPVLGPAGARGPVLRHAGKRAGGAVPRDAGVRSRGVVGRKARTGAGRTARAGGPARALARPADARSWRPGPARAARICRTARAAAAPWIASPRSPPCHGAYPGAFLAPLHAGPVVVTLPVLRSTYRSSPGRRMPSWLACCAITGADCACATWSSRVWRCRASELVESCSLLIWKEPSASVVLITSAETSAP